MWLIFCVGVIFLLSLPPLIPSLQEGGAPLLPTVSDGYYAPIIREVADGYPLLGNPWYYEHRHHIPPTFVLPYWIEAGPLLLGFSTGATYAFSFALWSVIIAAALFYTFRFLGLPPGWSAFASIIPYLARYNEISKTISMQMVQPVFVLLLVATFLWWQRPHEKNRVAFLIGVLFFITYGYTYLLQITVVYLLAIALYIALVRDWQRLRSALFVGGITAVLGIPFLALLTAQWSDPHYLETMVRTGLGYTHWPSGQALISATTAIPFLLLCLALWKWLYVKRLSRVRPYIALYFTLGGSVFFLSISNVLTGVDLETASHAARFSDMWLAIGSVPAVYYLLAARHRVLELPRLKTLILAALSIATIAVVLAHMQFGAHVFDFAKARKALQEERAGATAVQWLDENIAEPTVVWTDPRNSMLALWVPMYTKHYVLANGSGNLQLLSNDEAEERYMLSRSLSGLSQERIAQDVWEYNGVGAALDTPNTLNRSVKMCRGLHLYRLGFECGQMTDSRKLYDAHYKEMFDRYIKDIQPHMRDKLQKYHVTYLIKDKIMEADFHPERLEYVERVYEDGRYEIYKMK